MQSWMCKQEKEIKIGAIELSNGDLEGAVLNV